MVEVAALQVKAEYEGVKGSTKELDNFAKSADRADDANDRLTGSSRKADKAVTKEGAAARMAANDNNKLGRAIKTTDGSMNRLVATTAKVTAGIVAVTAAAATYVRLVDSYTQMTNSLKAMGLSGEEAASTLDDIAEIAKRTRSPLEATAQLYQRISIAGRDLGASQQEVLRFTENIGLALAQTGGSASSASGALLQLSQAMSGGVVRAEEFNSILEGAFPIAQAAANAIDGAAGSVGKLRNMVIEGKVSSDEFFRAILSQTEQLEEAFANTVPTIGQAFGVLADSIILATGTMDNMLGVSGGIATAILTLANNLERLAIYVGVAAAAFALSYTPAIIAATLATGRFVIGLLATRTALVRSGIGLGIVAAGELVYQFTRLVKGVGSFGAALGLLGDVAVEVWGRVGDGADFVALSIYSMSQRAKAWFISAVNSMLGAFIEFTWTVAEGLNSLFGSNLTGADARVTQELGLLQHEYEDAAAAAEKMAEAAKESFTAPLASVQALKDAVNSASQASENAATSTDAFSNALEELGGSGGKLDKAKESANEYASSFQNAFGSLVDGLVNGSVKGAEALEQLGRSLLATVLKAQLFQGLAGALPSIFGAGGFAPLVANANGNAFQGGNVIPFARGGVVNSATMFPMRNGAGLMGEAGPEAIMPLTRGRNGKLGVQAANSNGGGTVVNIINNTGEPVREQRTRGPDGREYVTAIVGEEMARGKFDGPLKARNGVGVRTLRR